MPVYGPTRLTCSSGCSEPLSFASLVQTPADRESRGCRFGGDSGPVSATMGTRHPPNDAVSRCSPTITFRMIGVRDTGNNSEQAMVAVSHNESERVMKTPSVSHFEIHGDAPVIRLRCSRVTTLRSSTDLQGKRFNAAWFVRATRGRPEACGQMNILLCPPGVARAGVLRPWVPVSFPAAFVDQMNATLRAGFSFSASPKCCGGRADVPGLTRIQPWLVSWAAAGG